VRRLLGLSLLVLLGAGALALAVYWLRPEWLIEAEYRRLAALAGVSERRITVLDHEIALYEGGSGPPVLLVHGFSGSKENWLPLMRHLRAQQRVIAIDLPGWGESTRLPEADYGIVAQTERLYAIASALELGRFALVGHSMGGNIVGRYAAEYGNSVDRLVLVATAGVHFRENDFARRVLAGETPFNVNDRAEWDRLLADLFVVPPWLPDRAHQVLIERNIASHAFHDRVIEVLRREPDAFRLESEAARIRVPVAVLWCDRDRVLDVSSLDTLRPLLPQARYEVLTGCGHMPMMEVPREMAAAMLPFLAR
jgi:pimeloyl-ACP methyl ester carboxylesterase